jgi:hypothetical protein
MTKTITLLIWVWLPNGQHLDLAPMYFSDEQACIQRVSEIMSKRYAFRVQAMCGHVIGD